MTAIGVLIVVPVTVMLQVHMMLHPEKLLKRDPSATRVISDAITPETRAWIAQQQCQFIGAFRFMQVVIALWKMPAEGTYVAVLRAQNALAKMTVMEFGTFLENGELNSTNGSSTFMFPPTPGNFKESILTQSLDTLYRAHLHSLEVLNARLGLRPIPMPADMERNMIESNRRQMLYVKSLPFYPFRGIYWFFVKRHRMRGKTIEDQFRTGMIDPNRGRYR